MIKYGSCSLGIHSSLGCSKTHSLPSPGSEDENAVASTAMRVLLWLSSTPLISQRPSRCFLGVPNRRVLWSHYQALWPAGGKTLLLPQLGAAQVPLRALTLTTIASVASARGLHGHRHQYCCLCLNLPLQRLA